MPDPRHVVSKSPHSCHRGACLRGVTRGNIQRHRRWQGRSVIRRDRLCQIPAICMARKKSPFPRSHRIGYQKRHVHVVERISDFSFPWMKANLGTETIESREKLGPGISRLWEWL
ncbi:hypothetical protein HNY73_017772 [Argiope bruennichi]|uniref:Uncharacterized protein n=1 Tax=Argiope bruennichi TaxID=94029 RepID=A0A8T0EDX4_ARGBR|nr:hypothetical protein HNY73_017772 [Argiope bruennichi]